MNNDKHTPRPWEWWTSNGWHRLQHSEHNVYSILSQADMALIAAAPDMLAALKTCRCPGGGWNGMPEGIDPTVENCMAAKACGCNLGDAIAKAEGSS